MPEQHTPSVHQTTFRFDKQHTLLHEDYMISEANRFAATLIQHWPKWKGHIALIYGPKKSGKTHLATIWQHHAHAAKLTSKELYKLSATEILSQHHHILVEDIQSIHDETVLFHLFNAVRENEKASMLLTASAHPNHMNIRLPDLKSRLLAAQLAGLELPDEPLLETLFTKHFSDHQLKVSPEVITYLVSRSERSFSNVASIVETLDRLALTHKRNITIPFIKEMAPQLGLAE